MFKDCKIFAQHLRPSFFFFVFCVLHLHSYFALTLAYSQAHTFPHTYVHAHEGAEKHEVLQASMHGKNVEEMQRRKLQSMAIISGICIAAFIAAGFLVIQLFCDILFFTLQPNTFLW